MYLISYNGHIIDCIFVLPCIISPPATHVIAHSSNEPANDHRRPSLFIAIHDNEQPGISTKHTKIKFKYLLPLKFVEFNDSP